MQDWNQVLDQYSGPLDAITVDPAVTPEDNASILFTSGKFIGISLNDLFAHLGILGTTGLPKGVLSTHRQYLTNVMNVSQ